LGGCEVGACLGVVGLDLQGGLVFGDGIRQAAGHLGKRAPEIVVGFREIRFAS
jgi:hypothetical protein